jgi:hypothetical protein
MSPAWTPKLQGNTLILSHKVDEADRKVFPEPVLDDWVIEVDWKGNIVWEYLSSYHSTGEYDGILSNTGNMVYRCYRDPYTWAPIEELPIEIPITSMDTSTFRLSGAAPMGDGETVKATI